MSSLVAVIAAAEPRIDEGHDLTAFFIGGGLFAVWAVILSIIGLTRPSFPGGKVGQRGVLGLSLVLAAGAIGTAVAVTL